MQSISSTPSRSSRPYLLLALFAAMLWAPIATPMFTRVLHVTRTETHVVARGESLWSIASRYAGREADVDAVVDRIVVANDLSGRGLVPGQQIRVPVKTQGS